MPFTDSVGASWRGRSVGRMGVSGLVAAVMPEMEGLAIVPGRHCTGFPGPTLGKMQSEAAGRAGQPSGEGEEASSGGLGGNHWLAQTDARRPASQVVGHHVGATPLGPRPSCL